MVLTAENDGYVDQLRASSCEPLLEASVEGATHDQVNDLPPLEGKWKSLQFRRVAMAKLVTCVCMMVAPLVAAIPVVMDRAYIVVCDNIGIAESECAVNDLANETMARFLAYENIFTCLLMLVLIPMVTGICHRFGYKASLAWSAFMFSASISALYINYYVVSPKRTYWRLLVSDVLDSLGGGIVVTQNVLLLALFQLFPEPELRPRYVSFSTGIIGITTTVSPSIGAYISRKYGVDKLLLVCAACVGASAIFALTMTDIPEYKFTKQVHEFAADADVPEKGWVAKVKKYCREQIASLSILSFRHVADPASRTAAFVLLFNQLSNTEIAAGGMNALFMFSKQYLGWNNETFSLVLTISTGSATFWGMIGFPLLQSWLLRYYAVNSSGVDQLDYRFLVWGSLVRLIGFTGVSAAHTSSQMVGAVAFKAQAAIQGPTFMTCLMKLIPASDGTALMTASALLATLGGIFVPTAMMQIYKVTLNWWPRLIFELETGINALQLLSLLFLLKVVPNPGPSTA